MILLYKSRKNVDKRPVVPFLKKNIAKLKGKKLAVLPVPLWNR